MKPIISNESTKAYKDLHTSTKVLEKFILSQFLSGNTKKDIKIHLQYWNISRSRTKFSNINLITYLDLNIHKV